VFVHRREAFAGEMLSRWRAWRSGGAGEASGQGGALRRCFKRWRGRLQDKRQLRHHAQRLARQRVFRQWKNHTRWAKNLQSTTLKTRAFERCEYSACQERVPLSKGTVSVALQTRNVQQAVEVGV
jgi:hypothetical protein